MGPLAALAAVLLALLAAVAASPVRLDLVLRSGPAPTLDLGLRLLWGLVPVPLLPAPPRRAARRRAPETRRRRPARTGGPSPRRMRRLAAAAPGFLGDLVGRIRLDRLEIDADIGLADPAETGRLWGALGPALASLPWPERARLEIRPDFTRARLDGRLEAAARLVPLALVPPVARFAWRVFGPAR